MFGHILSIITVVHSSLLFRINEEQPVALLVCSSLTRVASSGFRIILHLLVPVVVEWGASSPQTSSEPVITPYSLQHFSTA